MRIISIIQDQLISDFLGHLKSTGLSDNSIRFYKSDISHFAGWITLKVRSLGIFTEDLTDVIPFLKASMAPEYKKHLSQNNEAAKTINRRLSTLRRFSDFLVSKEILSFDFAKDLDNISLALSSPKLPSSLVEEFKKHLEENKASRNTVKNYIADVRHFLNWIEKNNYAA